MANKKLPKDKTMNLIDKARVDADPNAKENKFAKPESSPQAQFKAKFEAIYQNGFKTMDSHEISSKVAVLGGVAVIEDKNGQILELETGKPYQAPVVQQLPLEPMAYGIQDPNAVMSRQAPQNPVLSEKPAPNMTDASTGQPVNAQQHAREKLARILSAFPKAQKPAAPASQAAPSSAVDQFIAFEQ